MGAIRQDSLGLDIEGEGSGTVWASLLSCLPHDPSLHIQQSFEDALPSVLRGWADYDWIPMDRPPLIAVLAPHAWGWAQSQV